MRHDASTALWGQLVPSPLRLGCYAFALLMSLAFAPADQPQPKLPQAEPSDPDRPLLHSAPLAQRKPDVLKFIELPPGETGVRFANSINDEHVKRYLYNGSGVCAGDYDGNGLPDIYLVSLDGPNRLFRQVRPFKFQDVTAQAGVDGGEAWGTGAAFVDIDNDGDLDLYVCNLAAPNLLYVNQGDGTFTESARAYGLDHRGASTMAAFSDYDRDGDLDLYLLTNRVLSVAEEHPKAKLRMIDGKMTVHPDYLDQYFILDNHISEAGQRDILFRNSGDGTFEDVSEAAGISGYDMGLSATWWDYDNDGWPDLYVGNDMKTPDHLYHNEGNGTFTDVLAKAVPHTPWFSMGADFADINNDGWLDFFVADMSSTTHYKQKTTMGEMGSARWFLESAHPRQYMRNAFYLNSGTGRFLEIAHLTGLASTNWTWSVKFADLDHNGFTDVFFTNGMIRNVNDSDWALKAAALGRPLDPTQLQKQLLQMPTLLEENLVFRNSGGLQFENVSSAWSLNHLGVSQGAAYADFDRDGDLDLVINDLNGPARIYRNEVAGGHSLLIRLVGTRSNRFGIGARLTLKTASTTQIRELTIARGYMSADEPLVHFGMAEGDRVRRLNINWPSGAIQQFETLQVDRLYTITEPAAGPSPTPPIAAVAPQFELLKPESGLTFRHKERPFDDYQREPLLPNKLSQLGPGLAWGDIDGDEDDDLFVGGAAGQPGALFRNLGGGRFQRVEGGPWSRDSECEDMGAVWFDADSDGDMDLYVVSGGVEGSATAALLRDRLYLNTGAGSFIPAPDGILPDDRDSGSVVCAGDLDGDGDLDLFVGGRLVPGAYPSVPRSRLLLNDRGRFRDVTDERAPALRRVGLVTGALWSDADDDGRPDLLLTLEWGPIKFFHNSKGSLIDRTKAVGLDGESGWWNGIAGGDVDGDGDIDYVATNFGLNTKYVASSVEPAQLYCKDFDQNGTLDLVEGTFEHGKLFPIRGRSCSANAMPFVKEKFESFHDFALATLDEIYTDSALSSATRLQATRLHSVLLINEGGASFTMQPLPRRAQVAPGFGVVISDLDGDTHPDIYFVQNFFSPQPETGRMDGGLSAFLRGDGQGRFTELPPWKSGLVVPEDAMGLTLCDFSRDGWPDIVLTTNDGPLLAFRNRPLPGRRMMAVRLVGKPGNPAAVGARLTLVDQNGGRQSCEVYAGSGYLSQSSAWSFFGLGQAGARELRVRWPNGQVSIITDELDQSNLTLRQP